MKLGKRVVRVVMAFVLALSVLAGSGWPGVIAEVQGAEEEPKVLTAPQNLCEKDGCIVWDEVDGAYGYYLYAHNDAFDQGWYSYYVNSVEFDRFCHENYMDFGNYEIEVSSFDESGVASEWSNSITVTYAPVLEMPANVQNSEEEDETLLWDEVEGAAYYNIRIFYDDEHTEYSTYNKYTSGHLCNYKYLLGDTNNYWIAVQAIDRDYNVSAWTEPVLVTHHAVHRLDAPKHVRLDESGENILWEEVEGADGYTVSISSYNTAGNYWAYGYAYPTEPLLSNWKSYACPFADGKYQISVYAYNQDTSSYYSDSLEVDVELPRDESIAVPEDVWVEGNYLCWNDDVEVDSVWARISFNDEFVDYYGPEATGEIYIGSTYYPAENYDVELYMVDQNGNYNSKKYSLALGTDPNENVWIPELFYKFETLLWDYDRLRHDDTGNFWLRIKKDGTVVKLEKLWGEYFYGLTDLKNGDYTVDVCVYEYTNEIGPWSKPLDISVYDGNLFDKENEVSTDIEISPDAEGIPEEDRITSITINPAFNMKHKDGDDVELDLTKITIKANEIYDEEGLRRAEEALGETIKGNKHYNLLDLTLLYDNEDFSNGYEGLVQVVIPLPVGHRDKTFSCYRLTEVDGKMVKQIIPGEQTEDSYIIYLEHFSEYALVADGGETEHTHTFTGDWHSDENSHWKECECTEKSEVAEHSYGAWTTTKDATEKEEGLKERTCTVCGYKQTESVPKLKPTQSEETTKPSDPTTTVTPSAPSDDEKKPDGSENHTPNVPVTSTVTATSPETGDTPMTGLAVLLLLSVVSMSATAIASGKRRKS